MYQGNGEIVWEGDLEAEFIADWLHRFQSCVDDVDTVQDGYMEAKRGVKNNSPKENQGGRRLILPIFGFSGVLRGELDSCSVPIASHH